MTSRAADALARYYDLDLEDDPGDTDMYLALAEAGDGPILELMAGTGRVAVPLALRGVKFRAIGAVIDPAFCMRMIFVCA